MSEDSLFFKKLKKNFSELLDLIKKKQFIILEPKQSKINEIMLTKNFYNNHIYYKNPFNESLLINLNGKVIKYEHPKIKTYLGWSKEMIFNIVESVKIFDNNIQCLVLDNICDELYYDITKVTISKSQLQKKDSMEEYLKYNETLLNTNIKYKNLQGKISSFKKEMKNNYMFMKGFEDNYCKLFNERKYKFIKQFIEALKGINDAYNTVYNISSELLDSLIFSDMYNFLFKKCLVNFHSEEEKKIKKYLKDSPSKFDWDSLEVDEVYNKCKLQSAIQCLKKISSKKTVFEKIAVLNEVNDLLTAEAKKVYESQNKKNFILNGKDLIQFWVYVIAHCDTENILAEAQFLKLFGITGYSQTDYLPTNFYEAAKQIKDDILKNDNIMSRYIEPNKINLDGKN